MRCALAPGVPANLHARFRAAHRHPSDRRLWLDRDQFRHRRHRGRAPPGSMGKVRDGFDARIAGRQAATPPPGEPGELSAALRRTARLRHRLFRHARQDRRGVSRRLVSHRRPRRARSRRLFSLRRPPEGRHPPPRRKYLVVRSRAGAAEPSRTSAMPRCFRCRPNSPKTRSWPPLCAGRAARSPNARSANSASRGLPVSPCRVLSNSSTTLPTTENGKVQKYKLRDRGVTAAPGIARRRRPVQALERHGQRA